MYSVYRDLTIRIALNTLVCFHLLRHRSQCVFVFFVFFDVKNWYTDIHIHILEYYFAVFFNPIEFEYLYSYLMTSFLHLYPLHCSLDFLSTSLILLVTATLGRAFLMPNSMVHVYSIWEIIQRNVRSSKYKRARGLAQSDLTTFGSTVQRLNPWATACTSALVLEQCGTWGRALWPYLSTVFE